MKLRSRTTLVVLAFCLSISISKTSFAQQERRSGSSTELSFPCCTSTADGLEIHPNDSDFSSNTGRIMISVKHQNEDKYYTSYQEEDGKVKIRAYLPDTKKGSTIYFKVAPKDPDDLSSYKDVDDRSSATDDDPDKSDNLDLGIGLGVLSADNGIANQEETVNGVKKVYAEVELTITGQYAGDNYRVLASCTEDFATFVETTTLIAWKRVYLEKDQMYKRGAYLPFGFSKDTDGNDDLIMVNSSTHFQIGDQIILFDQDHESAAVVIKNISGQNLTIADLNDDFATFGGVRIVGKDEVFEIPITTATIGEAFGNGTDGGDGGAFVEFNDQSLTGSDFIPHFGLLPDPVGDEIGFDFSAYWFDHRDNSENAFQLVAAQYFQDQHYGITNSASNISIIAVQEHVPPSPSISLPKVEDTTIHELGHQFDVDQSHVDSDTESTPIHDGNTVSDVCIMSYKTNSKNEIFEFDFDRTNPHNSCIGDIRSASDPR